MKHLRAALAALWVNHCRACESIPRHALPVLWSLVASLGLIGGGEGVQVP